MNKENCIVDSQSERISAVFDFRELFRVVIADENEVVRRRELFKVDNCVCYTDQFK